MPGQRIEYVDVSCLPNGIRKAERSVAEASSGVDDMVSSLRFDLHPSAFEKILPIQECPCDVLFPSLDLDIMLLTRDQKDREWTERAHILGVLDTPACRSCDVCSILRSVEWKARVQVTENPKQNQVVVERS